MDTIVSDHIIILPFFSYALLAGVCEIASFSKSEVKCISLIYSSYKYTKKHMVSHHPIRKTCQYQYLWVHSNPNRFHSCIKSSEMASQELKSEISITCVYFLIFRLMLLDGCLVEKWKDQLNRRFKVNTTKEKNADILDKKLKKLCFTAVLINFDDFQISLTPLGIIIFT